MNAYPMLVTCMLRQQPEKRVTTWGTTDYNVNTCPKCREEKNPLYSICITCQVRDSVEG